MNDLIDDMRSCIAFDEQHFWVARLYPAYQKYKELDKAHRKEVIKSAEYIAAVSRTTLQRSFSAFAFLEREDVNIDSLQPGVTLMGLEASSKAMRIDRKAGSDLLDKVLKLEVTSREADTEFRTILGEHASKNYHSINIEKSYSGKPILKRGGVPALRGALASTSNINPAPPVSVQKGQTSEHFGYFLETSSLQDKNKPLEYREVEIWMTQAVKIVRGGLQGTKISKHRLCMKEGSKNYDPFKPIATLLEDNRILSSLFYLDTTTIESRAEHFEFLANVSINMHRNQYVYVVVSEIPSHLKSLFGQLKDAKPNSFFILENRINF